MSLDFFMPDDNEPKPGVLLIDLSQIALATAMQTYEPGVTFDNDMIRSLIISTLKHNAIKFKSQGFTKVILCLDNAKKGYWRRQESDYYKRNRAIVREAAIENNTFDYENYFKGLSVVIQELKDYFPYIVIDVDHCEADDCIAVLTKHYTSLNHKVRIISSDGDFTQLHKYPGVDQYSPMQKKFVVSKTGSPEKDCMCKIIKGDRKDCVASIKVRGDFYLTFSEDERTPPTAEPFIDSLLGKSDSEIKGEIKKFIETKLLTKPALKLWEKYQLEGHKELFDPERKIKPHGPDWFIKSVKVHGIEDEIILEYLTGHVDQAVELLTDHMYSRFIENRVLIDFDWIRQDISYNILQANENYVPSTKKKLYSYLVKNGFHKLISDINNF